jgi:hypothetical protein
MEVICPRCKRKAVGWPLRRKDLCSPKHWANCIREPSRIIELAEKKNKKQE